VSYLSVAGLPLDIIHTREISHGAVLARDGLTFECHRTVIDVDAVLNPAATSYVLPGDSNAGLPQRSPGQMPGVTEAAILWRLQQPRVRVVFRSGNGVIVDTPTPLVPCDVRGGPVVEVFSVREIHGDRTFLVSLRIVAHTNPSVRSNLVDPSFAAGVRLAFPILLSHTWRQSADVGRDHLRVITTEGVARFRKDELVRRGQVPDNFLSSLAPPLPRDFMRLPVQTSTSEDGTQLQYRIVDKQMHVLPVQNVFGLGPTNCTWVEAYHSRDITDPSMAQILRSRLGGYLRSVGNMVQQFSNFQNITPAGGGHLAAFGFGANLVLSASAEWFDVNWEAMPVLTEGVLVRAWGSRSATRRGLMTYAAAIALNRIGPPGVAKSSAIGIRHGIAGDDAKFVEFTLRHVTRQSVGTDTMALAQAGFPATDGTGGLLMTSTPGVAPPNSGGTRGQSLTRLQTQDLARPGQVPASWPTPIPDNVDGTLP
jgi:hypothetical protein